MNKGILFISALLILFTVSCHKEYSAKKIEELASLHEKASDYTESEIREIEEQVNLYFIAAEKMSGEALYERDSVERKKKIIAFLTWIKSENKLVYSVAKLLSILRQSDYYDNQNFESLDSKINKLLMEAAMLEKEL